MMVLIYRPKIVEATLQRRKLTVSRYASLTDSMPRLTISCGLRHASYSAHWITPTPRYRSSANLLDDAILVGAGTCRQVAGLAKYPFTWNEDVAGHSDCVAWNPSQEAVIR